LSTMDRQLYKIYSPKYPQIVINKCKEIYFKRERLHVLVYRQLQSNSRPVQYRRLLRKRMTPF
jgi:hypothetical protein